MTPNDPLYNSQWHFSLLGNIEAIWEEYTGAGVNVGVYDDGVDYNHADLAGNYDASLHVRDNNGNIVDPFPELSGDAHGTACAGIIGALGNNGAGGTGVAFGTTITGVNIFGENTYGYVNGDRDAFLDVVSQADAFDIMSNSWGSAPIFSQGSNLADPLSGDAQLQAEYALLSANARGGLGTVIVQAAGNDTLDANGDGTNASRFTATIAATDSDGDAQDYSNFGQNILVAAPAAAVTTDVSGFNGYSYGDYTFSFGGTSAATPVVSGVIALMLEANDSLGWRDVQNILAASAVAAPSAYDAPNSGTFDQGSWFTNAATNWNGGGMHFNVSYGYGIVDAFQAVRMAEAWTLFDPSQTSANEEIVTSSTYNAPAAGAAIPEGGTSLTFDMNVSSNVSIEHVGFYLEFDHTFVGDLEITMTSAEGTEITVLATNIETSTSFDGTWYFGIDSLLGENARGIWTVSIEDNLSGDSGSVQSAYLDVYGQEMDNDDVYHYTQEAGALVDSDSSRASLSDTNGGIDWINAAAIGASDLVIDLTSNGNGFGRYANDTQFVSISRGTVIENVVSSDGNDAITGNGTGNRIYGMRGDDEIHGLAGADRLYGGRGNDRIFDGRGDDTVHLSGGNDYVRIGGGADRFFGGSGIDFISYYDAPDGVTVNLRTDTVSGSSANDDVISNFEGISGSRTGNDVIYGTTISDDSGGDNTIRTYGGNDRVFDYSGDDTVELGSGNDYLRVGGGEDRFNGGIGVDYISYLSSTNGVTVNLRTETVSGSWAENDTVVNFESISGSSRGDDVIYGTTVSDDEGGANTIRTYGGNDRVFDYSGDDTVELGSGDDYVRVGGGQDSFDGGSGTDFISYYSSSNGVRLDFAADTAAQSWADNDTVVNFEGASGSRTGDDDLRGDENENVFRGNGGEDRLLGRDGDDRLYGGDDNDRLFGGDDDDQLYGDDGDDFLHGGRGTDDLYGGTGADVFHFDRGDGDVTVHDFENNIDLFQFDNFTGPATTSNQAFFNEYVRQQGSDVVFDFGADGTLTVANTTVGLVLNDFELV